MTDGCRICVASLSNICRLCRIFVEYVESLSGYSSTTSRQFVEYTEYMSDMSNRCQIYVESVKTDRNKTPSEQNKHPWDSIYICVFAKFLMALLYRPSSFATSLTLQYLDRCVLGMPVSEMCYPRNADQNKQKMVYGIQHRSVGRINTLEYTEFHDESNGASLGTWKLIKVINHEKTLQMPKRFRNYNNYINH